MIGMGEIGIGDGGEGVADVGAGVVERDVGDAQVAPHLSDASRVVRQRDG